MGRKKVLDPARETMPVRLYADTIRLAKILADAQDMVLADLIDWLVKDSIKRGVGKDVIELLVSLARQGAAPRTKGDVP